MIDWYIFIPACFALNLTFGPSNLLAMTNGARSGVVFAQRAAVGRLLCFIPMIAASALGLGFLLTASALVFGAVKMIGAAYLIWIGINLIRNANKMTVDSLAMDPPAPFQAFRNEAFVALSNPKAILIFAAFFPQFVDIDAYWQSYAMVGASFIGLEAIAIFLYASAGKFAAGYAAGKLPLMHKLSGWTMCLFGALLLVSPQPNAK